MRSDTLAPAVPAICTVLRLRVVACLAACLLAYGTGSWMPMVHMVRLGEARGLAKPVASQLLMYQGLGNVSMRLPL